MAELRDFVSLNSDQSGLIISYEQLINKKDYFANLPGIRLAWFNAISGLDTFCAVSSLFVIGRPLPAPTELRAMTQALTGRVAPEQTPALITKGALMADGTGAPIKVRPYADPDLETVRTEITDAEVIQSIGRGRGINRTADNPLTVWVLSDVLLPLPVSRLARWDDCRLSPVVRMWARGVLLTSPSDAAAFYANLFENAEAARWHLRGISRSFPYESITHRGNSAKSPTEVRYRPAGRGQQPRHAWVAEWRMETVREDLQDKLGPLALFEVLEAGRTRTAGSSA